jgi:putative heme iron utilization protein
MAKAAPGMISHVNADHADALREIVAAATGTLPVRARMRQVDRAGFLVDTTSPDGLRYVGFGREIEAGEAREVFAGLVRGAISDAKEQG